MEKKKLPDFRFEKKRWKEGFANVAGIDEVGRGCFAGPIVTGCVIFDKNTISTFKGASFKGYGEITINDSKQLTPKQRERADKWIRENALAWGIGEVSAQKINSIGMAKTAKICFRIAISEARKRLGKPIDFLLADAFFISYVPGLPARRRKDKKGRFYKRISGRQQAIIKGDTKSLSIAAASIIAKVYRDKLMVKLSKDPKYRKYGWGRNKGYGTREHQAAIRKYGVTTQHRKLWIETWLSHTTKD